MPTVILYGEPGEHGKAAFPPKGPVTLNVNRLPSRFAIAALILSMPLEQMD
jgi:hypothetical protein